MARILSGEKRGIEMNGEEILGLRKALGCTQEEFSKILGVTAVALSRWETGKAVPQGRNVAQLDYLQARLEKGDMEPETLKRIQQEDKRHDKFMANMYQAILPSK